MGDVFGGGGLPGDQGGAVGGDTGEGLTSGEGALLAYVQRISASATVVTLLEPKLTRLAAKIFNDSTDNLYVKFGSAATTSDFTVKLTAGAYFEFPLPVYLGEVTGIWDGTNGGAQITEEY